MTDVMMDRICGWCSLTFGSHRGGGDRCPGHEGQMDWEDGPGTSFVFSGWTRHRPYGTPAAHGGWDPNEDLW